MMIIPSIEPVSKRGKNACFRFSIMALTFCLNDSRITRRLRDYNRLRLTHPTLRFIDILAISIAITYIVPPAYYRELFVC